MNRIILGLLILMAAPRADSGELRVENLRYPAARRVQTHRDDRLGSETVTFSVDLTYPADDVLVYYDKELKRRGWSPFAEPGYETTYRKWDCYEDGTKPGNPLLHRLGAKWANPDRSRMAVLMLSYYSRMARPKDASCPAPGNNNQLVAFQLMPFEPRPPRPKSEP
jgi:hypothetical protein